MSDEVIAEQPAPEPSVTAAPEPVVVAPEVTDPEVPVVKTFTQAELDDIVTKRLAREQRKWQREQQAPAPPSAPTGEKLDSASFETPEAYAAALADRMVQDREAKKQHTEVVEAYHEREEDARTRYADFEQVAYNPSLRITDVMAQTIQASETGPDIAYFLGANPKEADRISRLPAIVQAKEIGRIEAKLAANPPETNRTSSAPAPIAPVTPRGTNTPAYDTTDPRSIKTMSTSEWIEAERVRQRKKLEARANR